MHTSIKKIPKSISNPFYVIAFNVIALNVIAFNVVAFNVIAARIT